MKTKLAMLTLAALAAANAQADNEVAPVKTDSVMMVGQTQTKTKKLKAVSADDDYQKLRFGGYGEMVAAFKDYGINRFRGSSTGNKKDHRNTIAIPRFVFALDYKFSPRWTLGTEIEFESGGVGTAYELENSENGEYETEVEKGGEVALEQFHITYKAFDWLHVRAGHLILPIGLTNEHHEPINFSAPHAPRAKQPSYPQPGTRMVLSSSAHLAKATPTSTTRPLCRPASTPAVSTATTGCRAASKAYLRKTTLPHPPTPSASTTMVCRACAWAHRFTTAPTRLPTPTNW